LKIRLLLLLLILGFIILAGCKLRHKKQYEEFNDFFQLKYAVKNEIQPVIVDDSSFHYLDLFTTEHDLINNHKIKDTVFTKKYLGINFLTKKPLGGDYCGYEIILSREISIFDDDIIYTEMIQYWAVYFPEDSSLDNFLENLNYDLNKGIEYEYNGITCYRDCCYGPQNISFRTMFLYDDYLYLFFVTTYNFISNYDTEQCQQITEIFLEQVIRC